MVATLRKFPWGMVSLHGCTGSYHDGIHDVLAVGNRQKAEIWVGTVCQTYAIVWKNCRLWEMEPILLTEKALETNPDGDMEIQATPSSNSTDSNVRVHHAQQLFLRGPGVVISRPRGICIF